MENIKSSTREKKRFSFSSKKEKMTRGDQRDRDRLARLKKEAEQSKGQRADGKSLNSAKEDDAAKMRAKQQAAAARKNGNDDG
jgi:hypothetical protein